MHKIIIKTVQITFVILVCCIFLDVLTIWHAFENLWRTCIHSKNSSVNTNYNYNKYPVWDNSQEYCVKFTKHSV
jgi:hypothetical protein